MGDIMARILNADNKYQFIMIFLISMFVSIVVLAVVLSNINFKEKVEGTVATILNDGDLTINYVDGDVIKFYDSAPHTYGITITNNSNNKLYYSIYFSEINVDDVNVKVKNKEGKVLKELNSDISNNKLINLYSIEAFETVRYSIIITNESKINFKGVLKVVNESMATEIFSDLILLNNNISVPKTRVGSEIATQNEGLISLADNKGTSYYFRGNVSNNYVKIGSLLFRIVRINGDETVRLVLNNVIDEQYAYNTNSISVGKDATSLVYLNSSSLINNLNNWMQNNLKDYLSYISNGDFCTDVVFNYDVNGIKYSSTYERLANDEAPDLYCTGNIYTGKVGLLSADEVVLAGAAGNVPNTSYYLYNENIKGNYLTNSSYFINTSNNAAVMNVMSNGALGDGILVTNSAFVRPVINLGINAKVKGEGTLENPYIIVS